MSLKLNRDSGCVSYRRQTSADGQQPWRHVLEKPRQNSISDATSLKRPLSAVEENFPKVLPLLLDVVRDTNHLPADEASQEMLKGKLRLLQADATEIKSLFKELSTHLVSISSEEKVIYVTFQTFEEIWKFTTYYTIGFVGHCLENILFDPAVWLSSLDEDIAIEVSIQEETLQLFYNSVLMQEGSLFASCTSSQMFDSSTSGGDLYLEQGDIAQFEPPFLDSGWTVLCLADGARGTTPKPALEPVIPFHQWFLKSCPDNILVGDGKPSCDFPLQFARGTCLATGEYDAERPEELSVVPGDRIIIFGLLVSCFHWFTGRKEATGEVGLVKTSLVKPSAETWDSADIFLDGEDWMSSSQLEDKIIEEVVDNLKRKSRNDSGQSYKLDMIAFQDSEKKTSFSSDCNASHQQMELKENIGSVEHSSPHSSCNKEPVEDSGCGSLPRFVIHQLSDRNNNSENFLTLFSFLEGRPYRQEFALLYGPTDFSSVFTGYSDEEELIAFLGIARETARKRRLFWTQTRLCFLLGKLCAGRSKFSQARVYFEESLGVPREAFTDFRLLAGIFSHLAAIYILQKNKESFFAVTERLAALLMGIPDCVKSFEDTSVLFYILKKAVLCQQKRAEARACFLLARHHLSHGEADLVVPYLERLLAVGNEAQKTWNVAPSSGYITLGQLYNKLQCYHLSVSSAKRASLQPSLTLSHCLGSMMLVLHSVDRHGQETSVRPQVAPYFQKVLSVTMAHGGGSALQHVLSHQLTLSLCQILYKHGLVGQAINHMMSLINNSPSPDQVPVSVSERNGALIWFAWLHINNNQPDTALSILDSVLASMSGHCRSPQEGVVLNMRGVALRCVKNHRGAAESYQAAADICKENEDMPNWAVAQANLGLLCLKAGAKGLAQRFLTEAVQLFSEISDEGHEENFIMVMLELGQLYVMQKELDYGRRCYEWALLLAIRTRLLDSQLRACRHLCHLYGHESPNQARCIIYSQHQVQLFRCTGDRRQEGDMLEVISQLYLSLETDRAYRAALDCTKSSLAIFIDLGCREKEAYAWLKAGRIYQLLGQTELVDIYVQAAQEVSLSTGDTHFVLKLLEDAGDIFFNSYQDRDKAITFYRDRALPIAVKSNSARTRLRLCNKLAELLFCLKLYGEAVEFAKTAADISISQGECLNERVSYHRLASLYRCLQQHELAEHYYLKALCLCPTPLQFDEETLYYVKVYQTLGDIIFCDLKDPFDAAGYYHLALAAAMDLGNKRSQLQLCTRLATIYHNFIVDRELSLFFYQKARAFAAELNVRRINISSHQQCSSGSQYQTSGP